MTAIAVDDAWMETCLIAISPLDGSDVQFAGITETVDPDIGEKDIEGKPLVNGGRVTVFKPEGDTTITLEAYPLEAGTSSGTVGKGFFDLMHSADVAVPIRVINDHVRTKYRMLLLWTNDPTVTTAESITTENYSAFRIGAANGHITAGKPDFTDGTLKYTVKFKCAAFDKAGDGNIMMESCAGAEATDILPVIAAYTATAKFD